MGSRAFQFIECDIVAGEELIATVDILVHTLGEGREELRLGQFCQFIDPGVDGSGTVIHHPTLITEDTCLHIIEIVLTTLLEAWDVAFLLQFLGFQVVTGIKLITDGEWHDVEFAQTIGRIFQFIGGAHGQHLQHGVLRAVVRVLRPTLTLSDPDVLLFLGDGIVDITAHQLTGAQHLFRRESATHREGLVHTNQPFDPGIDEQIVTDSDLNGCRVTVGNEHHVEKSGVEYNVTMVGDERITSRLLRIDALQITIIEGAAVGVLADDVPDDGFHKPQLEVERCLDAREGQLQESVTQTLGQPGHKALQYQLELSVVEQVVERLLHFLRFIRSDLVEFLHI